MCFCLNKQFRTSQTLYQMSSLCRSYECMNIVQVNIGVLTGWKKIKQWRISFVLGYLRMILWKISTAISIKHRILATSNIKKKINSDSLYAFNCIHILTWGEIHAMCWLAENDIIIRDITDKIQQMTVCRFLKLQQLLPRMKIWFDWFIVFNATFSNISAISWRPVLVVE
jgi:hypothetical protein